MEWRDLFMRNGMSLTFSQQILCGKLLQIVIGEIKKSFQW